MLKIYNFEQGTKEWLEARLGLLTASEMKLILTPALKSANNDKSRAHVWEILSQRITGIVEESYQSEHMLRGHFEEVLARQEYHEKIAPVETVGFMTEDKFTFTLGYSPDGLVGDNGLIEVKSRKPAYQARTIVENEVPQEYILQLQTALLVSGRKWIDFISYCGGMPMFIKRVWPDDKMQDAILEAASAFEVQITEQMKIYKENSKNFIPTERLAVLDGEIF